MAIAATVLASSITTTDATSYNTASISPAANSLLLVFAASSISSVPPAPTITVSGLGLTWTTREDYGYDPSSPVRRITAHTAQCGASPGSGALTLSMDATSTHAAWVVIQITGHNVSAPVVQSVVDGVSSGTTMSLTLASPADPNNRAFSWWGSRANSAGSPRTNWTELFDGGVSSPAMAQEAQWRSDAFETTASVSFLSSARIAGIALEIAAAGASPGVKTGLANGSYAFTGTASGTNNEGPGLPGLIDGIEPEAAGSFRGPYVDGNGNLYTVTEEYLGPGTGMGNHPMMMKSSDGGVTWTRQDAVNGPGYGVTGSLNDIEASWLLQSTSAKQLYFLYMKGRSRWFSSTFCTSDHPTTPDQWVTAETSASAGIDQFATQPSESGVAGVLLSNGNIRAFVRGNPQSSLEAFLTRTRTGTTWGSSSYITDTVGMSRPCPVVANSDTTYLFYRDITNGQVRYRTISSSGTVGSSTRVDSSGAGTNTAKYMNNVVPPVYYDDGGTPVVVVGFVNGSDELRTVEVRGGVVGSEQQVSSDTVTVDPVGLTSSTDSQGPAAALAVVGKTLYALWGDNTSGNLYYATRANGGSWSARTLLATTGTGKAVHWAYANAITKPGGSTYIAYTYDVGPHDDDASDIYYNELLVSGPPDLKSGTAAGSFTFTGSSTGSAPVLPTKAGTASGSYAFTGTATGSAPSELVSEGHASGVYVFAGFAAGQRTALVGSASGTFVITGEAVGSAPEAAHIFLPPTYPEQVRREGNLFVNVTRSMSVVRINGVLQTVKSPSVEVLEAAGVEGADYFIGGHIYRVTEEVATELENAGFTVT